MFTSYNNSCDNNMVVVDDDDQQIMFDNRSFENDISPNYKPDNLSFSFIHFSPATTFFDQDDAFLQYHSHLLQQSAVVVDSPDQDSITTTTTMALENQTQTTEMAIASVDINDPAASKLNLEPNNKTTSRKIPKRRLAGKKDRHSKIVTAQGPRDRRMRLSLQIAREFFSLQDMLGVDKPSKTVQWLLTMSKSAIEELTISLSQTRNNNKYHSAAAGTGSVTTTGSPMSECCEVASEIEENVAYNQEEKTDHDDRRSADFSKRKSLESSSSMNPNKGKKIKPSRKINNTYHHHPLARESREKARARARERTIEKKQQHSQSKQCVRGENLNNNELTKVKSLTLTSKEGEESSDGSGTYDMKSTLLELVMRSTDEVGSPSTEEEHQGSLVKDKINVDLEEEESCMITTRKASSSSIFSYHGDIGLIGTNVLNFSEMWDFANNAGQTNSSYRAIADMNLPAGNIKEYCLPSSSSIPDHASPNTRLQSQFANLPLFCGKP